MTGFEGEVMAGQAVYTRRTLAAYDVVVLGLSNRFIWRCPTMRLLEHYNRHVSGNHLDVGVGTGYFLARCRFPSSKPRIALMDLNQDSLDFAARRIAQFAPETYRRNVLEPIALEAEQFDSVSLNYLLHCLPGSMESKAVMFDHIRAVMRPSATIFGSTLLQAGGTHNWAARRLMTAYNERGIFSNRGDDLDSLRAQLERRFTHTTLSVVGSAALFSASKGD